MKRYLSLFKEGFISLKSNILRSMLTVLGIVIGIFAVTSMLALGDSLTKSVTDRFNAFSTGDIVLSSSSDNQPLTERILDWVKEKSFVKETVGLVSTNAQVYYQDSSFTPSIMGYVGDYSQMKKFKLVSGKMFDYTDLNNVEYVGVADNRLAEKFKEDTGESIVGKTVLYKNSTPIVVTGIIEFTDSTVDFGDGELFVPYKTVSLLSSAKGFSRILVNLNNTDHYTIAQKNIVEGINSIYGLAADSEDVVYAYDNSSFLQQQQEILKYFSMFLGAVGAISLIVGGIGTMNMILTTVTERKKEIGLRKAIGAHSSDITIQILFESILLTLTGGILGIIFTNIIMYIVDMLIPDDMDITIVVSYSVMITSIIISIVIGIVFGISPARKAAKMQPTDALRSD